jgi:hypothetical protein
MELKKELRLTMTKEQEQVLKKAVDILTDMELDMESEELDLIQEKYDEELDYIPHDQALPTAIDYIGTLLTMAEIVEEKGEEDYVG